LDDVKKAASHFGMAFQIVDDIGDMEQDVLNNRKVNMANVCGKDEAIKMFHEEIDGFDKKIMELGLEKTPFLDISRTLRMQLS
jgi:geranylgeranyl diphosphate synthase type II